MSHYYEVYSNGVGTSCKGDCAHHEVLHLVSGYQTICGVAVSGRKWVRESSSNVRQFELPIEKHYHGYRPSWNSVVICSRCAKKYQKELKG